MCRAQPAAPVGDEVLRMFVTPASVVRPLKTNCGDGMPQRAMASSCTSSSPVRTMGAA